VKGQKVYSDITEESQSFFFE